MRTYDYPTKNEVRGQWMRFLANAHLDRTSRRSGLYLPGPENLELPGYLQLGFSPSNLYGAEHDEKALEIVQRAAQGVNIIPGSVQDTVGDMIAREVTPLTFACLDFEGSYHTFLHDLLSVFRIFPALPSGCLAVTSYAARDDDTVEQGMVNFSKFWSGMTEHDVSMFYQQSGLMLSRYSALQRHLASRAPAMGNVSRELGFLWWIVIAMSFTRYDKNGYGSLDKEAMAQVDPILKRITQRATEERNASAFSYVTERELGKALAKRKCELWPRSLVHIVHGTNSRQPMRTWFLDICRIPHARDRYSAQEVLRQTWQLAARAPLMFVDRAGTKLTIEESGR